MKRPSLKDRSGDDKSSIDNQVSETLSDALSSNDKVIEIRPAKQSKGMGLKRLLLMGVGAISLAYWARKSQKPDELIESVKEETANRTHKAAETIEKGSETASERIEEGSERASEAVHEAGEKAADRTEKAGEKASDRTEEAGKEASDGSDSDSSSSSRSSRSSSSSGNTRT